MPTSLLYQSKEARDKRYKELVKGGRRAIRSRVVNQALHPMFVQDFVGPEKHNTRFGNSEYRLFFKVLYEVQIIS